MPIVNTSLFVPSDDEDMSSIMREADEESNALNKEAMETRQRETEEAMMRDFDDPNNPMVTLLYYKHLFPFRQCFQWLNLEQTPSKMFTHREFAFTLAGDVYLRYNSFNGIDEWKKETCRLNPVRFEIGPVYSARPRDKKQLRPAAFKPQQRELIFDIDMTDYDDIRTCCVGKGMCKECWGFVAGAVKVLDKSLREDFGYEHLLWVYSGRRGIHCWISDESARLLSDDQRRSVVNYLEMIKGGASQHKKVTTRGVMHPSTQRALDTLQDTFNQVVCRGQGCFDDPEKAEAMLQLLSHQEAAQNLRRLWQQNPGRKSKDKWKDLLKEEATITDIFQKKDFAKSKSEIMLQYTYPRIDTEVSKHQNHLLKSPFCIHPGTGRVCVPVDPNQVDSFDPDKVPTIGVLLREWNEIAQRNKKGGLGIPGWEQTSLRPYVEMLEKFVTPLMEERMRAKKASKLHSLDF